MKKILVIVFLLLVSRMFTFGIPPVTPNEKPKKIALTFDVCMTTGMLKRIASGKDPFWGLFPVFGNDCSLRFLNLTAIYLPDF